MKKAFLAIVVVVIVAIGWGYLFYRQNANLGPVILPPLVPNSNTPLSNSPTPNPTPGTPLIPGTTPPAVNTTGLPLKLPAGFSISTFVKNVPDARVIAFDSLGNLWVSEPANGVISLIEINNGQVTKQTAVFKGLRNPHGLAFDPASPSTLYFAEENKISRVQTYSEDTPHKVIDLPDGGEHITRTIGFGPDGRLYVAIGSDCNVCNEKNDQRAKIFSLNKDGSDFKQVAGGLRNSVFFTWNPSTQKMWATEMGRDYLGDNVPPDEINIIEPGNNYGWPICYGQNIHDTNFDKSKGNPCAQPATQPAHVDLQAHSAPLGLAFVPDSWPTDYQNDLIVAFHGSWNRSVPTGYELERVKLDANGNYVGVEDFISGWLSGSRTYGRPVDVIVGPDKAIYVSDDKAGVIYKINSNQ